MVELLLAGAYPKYVKFIKKYLILCLLFVMPLQGIAASAIKLKNINILKKFKAITLLIIAYHSVLKLVWRH
ncbi:MAG: hypothetical protein EB109_02730 [Methylophilaceae bacterium]|nr:hypothetical protein [Methylophilaceae bacterium]